MRAHWQWSLLLVGALASLGCGASYGDGSGTTEPVIIVGSTSTFHEGELPDDGGPALLLASSGTSQAYAGGPEKTMSGRTTSAGFAVALRMKDAGTGYWVVPVGLPDLNDPGLDWSTKVKFTRQAPLGDQIMLVAQTDVNGKFGKASEVPFKIKSLLPGGTKVISLIWHNHADLDLKVQGPDGKTISAKHPNTAIVKKGETVPTDGIPGSGQLDRDSNADCVFDGLMQEDLVFNDDPDPGPYDVWVDEFSSCGEPATTFELQLHEDGDQTFSAVGQVLDINADNGTGRGLYMHTFSF